ncbi:MAG: FHA domain-containing protein [Micrococcales bacterium]|nr:FHA domain-containing protein [Micrococcales bacterium]
MLSATPSASAQPAQPAQAAPSEEQVERTVLIDRAASRPWSLLLDDGRRFDLWAPSVLVGRAPSAADPGTQVLAISDETCTISKVHARLDLVDGTWQVADAGSTNGIIVTRGGRAFTVPSGTSAAVDEQLVLGSVGMRLVPGGQLQPARA